MTDIDETARSLTWQDQPSEYLQNERQYPTIAAHSCQHCNKLVLDIRKTAESTTRRGRYLWIVRRKSTGFTFANALRARAEGCALFAKLVEDNNYPPKKLDGTNSWDPSSFAEPKDLDREIVYSVNMSNEPFVTFDLRVLGPWPHVELMHYYYLHPLVAQQPIYSFIGRVLPPNLALGSPLAFRQARSWLEECHTSHKKCQAAMKTYKPHRLLSVGTAVDRKLRLVQPSGIQPYVALSYCWGGDQPGKTTKANIQSYSENISPDILPQTILDAIAVARGINCPFLWVDALCIIQDDNDDKFLQISQMHSVYRGARLVTAATCASKCTDGFLQPRERFRPVKAKVIYEEGRTGHTLLSPTHIFHEGHRFYQRGWTFQEQMLSPRTLTFDDGRMGFSCLQESWEYSHQVEMQLLGARANDWLNQCFAESHPSAWISIVKTYSKRVVSEPQDRLAALAAVSTLYAENFGLDGFLAGFWRHQFLHQLVWSVLHYYDENDEPSGTVWRPSEYMAPSWSWASLFGQVSFRLENDLDPRFTCTLLNAETTLLSPTLPFGHVTEGKLTILGIIKQAIWLNYRIRAKASDNILTELAREWGSGPDPHKKTSLDDDYIPTFYITMDTPWDWKDQKEVPITFLEIFKAQSADRVGNRYGLLLYPSSSEAGSSTYVRIGSAWVDRESSFLNEGFEWTTVTII